MITEKDIEEWFAEIILGIIKNPVHETNVDTFCSEYHLDWTKLTSKNFFSMYNDSLFRLWMGIAQLAELKEYLAACIAFAIITYKHCRKPSTPHSSESIHWAEWINRLSGVIGLIHSNTLKEGFTHLINTPSQLDYD